MPPFIEESPVVYIAPNPVQQQLSAVVARRNQLITAGMDPNLFGFLEWFDPGTDEGSRVTYVFSPPPS